MYKKILVLISIFAMIAVVFPSGVINASAYSGVPTISIMEVTKGPTVTVQMDNFPEKMSFVVRMAPYGNYGYNGTIVDTIDSGEGGKNAKTFVVPDALKNEPLIAIRMENPTYGYFTFNFFRNPDAGTYTGTSATVTATTSAAASATATPAASGTATATPVVSAYPSFQITGVTAGSKVSIQAVNMPANQDFDVTMGYIGTAGIGGTAISTMHTGTGGSIAATYDIPAALASQYMIAIRLQNPTTGVYAYNWFYNTGNYGTGIATAQSTTTTPAASSATATPAATKSATTAPSTTGTPSASASTSSGSYPVINVTGVTAGSKVTMTVTGINATDTFAVLMGKYGTNGAGGTEVGKVDAKTATQTFTIPTALASEGRIAVRLQNTKSGSYTYTWFYNVTSTQ
jgi:hypothetical protein